MTQAARREGRGLALVLASALAYGVLPILAKLAYAAGVRALALLAWRYAIAAVLIALLFRSSAMPLRVRVRLWAVGSVFVVNSVAYFRALETLPASVVSLVLYTYPMMVVLLSAAAGLEQLSLRGLLAAVLAFAGCALTARGGGPGATVTAAGVAWALLAAFVYACYIVLSGRFGADAPARALALHLAQVAAVACAALALVGPGLALPPTPLALGSVAAIAVVPTVVAMTAFLAGMAIVGPTRASVLSSVEVVVTLALAFVVLGERLAPEQWGGALLILGAGAWQNLGPLRAAAARRGASAPLL